MYEQLKCVCNDWLVKGYQMLMPALVIHPEFSKAGGVHVTSGEM